MSPFFNTVVLRKVSLFIACFFFLSGIRGQSWYFRHYQVENGLSNNAVICSMQDTQGFLWFGTKDGLNRFDGYAFKVFRANYSDPGSLGSNFIKSLSQGQNGTLWVGTDRGLFEYSPITESFTLIGNTGNQEIRDIKMDNKGDVWFLAGLTLYKYMSRTKQVRPYDPGQFFLATSLCISADGTLWASSYYGYLEKYDRVHDNFTAYPVYKQQSDAPINGESIEKICDAGEHALFVGTTNRGVKIFDTRTFTTRDILTFNEDGSEIFVRDILRCSDDEWWIATESGLFIYNTRTAAVNHLRKQYNDPYSISDNAVYTLCRDREGGIWAGTYFGGVNYYPRQYISFDKYFPKTGENSISGNAVREICMDRLGDLWIGTEDAGLNEIKAGTHTFTHYLPGGKKTDISYYNVHGLLATGNELWVGSFEHGLDIMDIRTGKVKKHYSTTTHPNTLKSNFIYCLARTRQGKILVGTGTGLYEYNEQKDDFTAEPFIPSYDFVTDIYCDETNTIWVGTFREGIYYYNPVSGEKGNFRFDLKNNNSICDNRVNGIFEDSHHSLWFTTEGGVSKLDRDRKTFATFNTQKGLPSNVTYRTLEDRKNIWISTSNGLVCLNPATSEIQIYTKANGLLSDQFNYNSAFKDEKGKMYFGSVKGLISFDPDAFEKNNFIPPVYITGFQVYDKELAVHQKGGLLQQSVIFTDKIVLPYDQSSFSIDFAALSFTAPEMTEYSYRMEGLNKDWTYLKSNRKVYFTELPPGTYTFQVRSSNSGNNWRGRPATLIIKITPPFWRTVYAYAVYSILLLLMIYGVMIYYHRRTEEKNRRKFEHFENEKEKEIYHAKIEFFTNIAHEIRTPLTLIKLPLEKTLAQSQHDAETRHNLHVMEKNTNRLISLTNQLLDFRKTESNGFSLSFVKADIPDLVKDLYAAFKPAAEQKNLLFRIELPRMPFQAYVDVEAFKKITSNLLNNAIKYAETTVILSIPPFSSEDDLFSLKVVNDGFLIPAEKREKIFEPFFRLKETEKQEGTGIGLTLARSLAELHKGSLTVTAEDGRNTFYLALPFHQEKEFQLFREPEKSTDEASSDGISHTAEVSGEGRSTILLVEDNNEILEFIAGELGRDYTLLRAHNGSEALERLKDEAIQLVISDVMMPVMGGFELCEAIKSNFEHSHIPVILLTAKNTLQSKVEGLEKGADAYIEKPFSMVHLQAQIGSLLTNRNKIKQYFASSPLVHIKTIAYSKWDETFLVKLTEYIDQNISNLELSVEHLAKTMNMSKPTFYRKIKALSNLSPNELINITRLKKAAQWLSTGDYKVYEVAEMAGYSVHANFSRDFMKQFGISPSDYMHQKRSK